MANAKAKAQIRHAFRRASERYDLNLTKNDLANIKKLIQENKTKSQCKQSNRVTVHILDYENQEIKVVYDKIRKTLVTFLPNSESE